MSCDLELEITTGTAPGHYIITVDSPAGAASGQLRLDTEELLEPKAGARVRRTGLGRANPRQAVGAGTTRT